MINYKKADLNELNEIIRCRMEFIREDMGPQTAETETTIQAQLREYLKNHLNRDYFVFVALRILISSNSRLLQWDIHCIKNLALKMPVVAARKWNISGSLKMIKGIHHISIKNFLWKWPIPKIGQINDRQDKEWVYRMV